MNHSRLLALAALGLAAGCSSDSKPASDSSAVTTAAAPAGAPALGAAGIAEGTGRPDGGAGVIAVAVVDGAPALGSAVSPSTAPSAAVMVTPVLSVGGLLSLLQPAARQSAARARSLE